MTDRVAGSFIDWLFRRPPRRRSRPIWPGTSLPKASRIAAFDELMTSPGLATIERRTVDGMPAANQCRRVYG